MAVSANWQCTGGSVSQGAVYEWQYTGGIVSQGEVYMWQSQPIGNVQVVVSAMW
jgi:hypothetical protein